MNRELPDAQAGFREGRGVRGQSDSGWTIERARGSMKTPTSASATAPKPLTVGITANCGKLFKTLEYQTT